MVDIIKTLPSNLKAEATYAVRVRSLNAFGVPSDWSESLVVNTTAANLQSAQRLVVTNDGMVAYNTNGQIAFNYAAKSVIRTNLVKNPSFEANIIGWTNLTNSTLSRITTDFFASDPAYGPGTLKVTSSPTLPATTATQVGFVHSLGDRFAVTAGLPYTVTLYIRVPSGQPDVDMRIGFRFYNGGGTQISEAVSINPVTVSSTNNWIRLNNVAITAPSGSATAGVVVYSDNAMAYGAYYYVDAILVEQATTIGEYFDGSSSVGTSAWTGSIHASSSTLNTNSVYGVNQGLLTSQNYVYTSGNYSDSGTQINLETGYIRSKNFYIDAAGNAGFGGAIDVGGDDNTSFHVDLSGNMWVGAGISGYSTAPFKVSSTGQLTASYFTLLGVSPYAGIPMLEMGNYLNGYYGFYMHHNDTSITQESLIVWSQKPSGNGSQLLYFGGPRGSNTANRPFMYLDTNNNYLGNQVVICANRFGSASPGIDGGDAIFTMNSSNSASDIYLGTSLNSDSKAYITLNHSGDVVFSGVNTIYMYQNSAAVFIADSTTTRLRLSNVDVLTATSTTISVRSNNINRFYADNSNTIIRGDTVWIYNAAYTVSYAKFDSNGITVPNTLTFGTWGGSFWMEESTWIRTAKNLYLNSGTLGTQGNIVLNTGGSTDGSYPGWFNTNVRVGGFLWVQNGSSIDGRVNIAHTYGGDYSEAGIELIATTGSKMSFHVPGVMAPQLRAYGGFGRIDCISQDSTGYYDFGCLNLSQFSSIEMKDDVHRLLDDDVLRELFWVEAKNWKLKNPPKVLRPNAKFRDINARWVARGKTPLTVQKHHEESDYHDCSIDTCNGTKEEPCALYRHYHGYRMGLVAEELRERFPDLVRDAVNEEDTTSIKVGDVANLALGSTAALTREVVKLMLRVEELEQKLQQM